MAWHASSPVPVVVLRETYNNMSKAIARYDDLSDPNVASVLHYNFSKYEPNGSAEAMLLASFCAKHHVGHLSLRAACALRPLRNDVLRAREREIARPGCCARLRYRFDDVSDSFWAHIETRPHLPFLLATFLLAVAVALRAIYHSFYVHYTVLGCGYTQQSWWPRTVDSFEWLAANVACIPWAPFSFAWAVAACLEEAAALYCWPLRFVYAFIEGGLGFHGAYVFHLLCAASAPVLLAIHPLAYAAVPLAHLLVNSFTTYRFGVLGSFLAPTTAGPLLAAYYGAVCLGLVRLQRRYRYDGPLPPAGATCHYHRPPYAVPRPDCPAFTTTGIVFAGERPQRSDAGIENQEYAVAARLCAPQLRPPRAFVTAVCRTIWRLLSPMRDWRTFPPTRFSAWVARFPRAVADRLRAARQAFVRFTRRDYRHEGFVKSEKVLKVDNASYKPRLIETCTPSFNCWFGPIFHAFSSALKDYYTVLAPITYGSPLCGEDLAFWHESVATYRYFYDVDRSLFDSSVHFLLLVHVLAILYHLAVLPLWLFRTAVTMFSRHSGATRDGVRYGVVGRVVTGWPGTTVFNTLLATGVMYHCAFSCLSVVARASQLAAERAWTSCSAPLRPVFRVLGAGDDAVLASDEPLDPQLERLAGFQPKVRVSSHADLRFCSGFFVPVEPYETVHGPLVSCFAPLIARQAYKFGYIITDTTAPCSQLLAEAIGHTDWAHVPILRALRTRTIELLRGVKADPAYRAPAHRIVVRREHHATGDTFAAVAAFYRVDAASLHALEEEILRVDSLPFAIDSPLLRTMLQTDLQ
jgi:hypothetical protein